MIKSSQSGKRNVNCCQLVQTYKNCFKERQFQLVEKPYIRFASGGLAPGPPTGHCPCTLVGALAAPRPPAQRGGLWPSVRPTFLHSPSTSNLFDNPDSPKARITLLLPHATLMHILNSKCCGVDLLLHLRYGLQLFFQKPFSLKNNTCDFKSNLHCMLI